ncbi:MAG: transglycosylase domain-containing protein [Bacteroidota bacterium]
MNDFLQKTHARIQHFKELRPRVFKALLVNLIVIGGLFLIYLLFFASIYFGAFGPIPKKAELAAIKQPVATEVYASDEVLLGRYYVQNRTEVEYESLSPWLVQGLIATEDARFYSHSGVDYRSMARVMFKSILMGDRSSGGGSTISQQLAKNLFPRKSYKILSTPINKIREALTARRLEKIYTKEEIITQYLNTVPFGETTFGIRTAAKRFFNKTPATLNIEEAATLVGMLKATSYYNPRLHPERAQERRNTVLDRMATYEVIKPSMADSLKKLEVQLTYKRFTPIEGLAPYFRAHLTGPVQEILEAYEKATGTSYNLYTEGLKIYTSIDSRLQTHAEQAVTHHMKGLQETFFKHWKDRTPWGKDVSVIERATLRSDRYKILKDRGLSEEEIIQNFATPVPMRIFSWEGEIDTVMKPIDSIMYYAKFLNAGFLAMDPHNGKIRAWVGGINFRHFKYDHVLARRQVGSTFKPIVYATALEQGYTPCEYLENEQVVYEEYENWSPGNADDQYGGLYSLAGGLTHSVNTISVALLMKAGVGPVVQKAYEMGIESDIPLEPSIALGTADLALYEMLPVYASIANGGYKTHLNYLERIEAPDGTLIYEADPPASTMDQVLSPQTAELMQRMLEQVVDSGTGRSLRYRYNLKGKIGGKTGTTQAHADGWFMGFTPSLVAGAWVGAEDPKVRFRSLSLGQGAKTALPIWGEFMRSVRKDPKLKAYRAQYRQSENFLISEQLDCPMFIEQLEIHEQPFREVKEWFDTWRERRKLSPQERRELRKRDREERKRKKRMRKQQQDNFDYLTPEQRSLREELKRKYGYKGGTPTP